MPENSSKPLPKRSSPDTGPELIRASRVGNLKKVKELIAQGADVNYNALAGTPLANAVRAGHIDTAAELIKAGADIHHRSLMGSLVECAVTEDQPKMLSFLLKAGAKPGGSGSADKPLLRAAAENKLDCAKILLKAGADVNETGSVVCGDFGEPEITEETSGGMAVRTTHVPNPPVARAATPLIVAVRRGFEEMIRLLLEAGADPNRTDKEGFSTRAWATRSGNTRIVELLQRRGAKALQFPEDGPARPI